MKDYKKAGEIAAQAREYAKSIIKPGMKLLDIAEKTEAKILALGGKPAFPVNLSINEIAAHSTPSSDDETLASGLLKVDLGVHISGAISDLAFSLDLTKDKEHDKLIKASHEALENALKTIKPGIKLREIGKIIQNTITSFGFSPIVNLSGHALGEYKIHAGITIPNCDNGNNNELESGAYAIEPFATTGEGRVTDGKPSGIYRFEARKAIRDPLAREILAFIEKEYKTLPFCGRWLVKKFGTRALLALSLLEQSGIIYQYPQLIEKSKGIVSQAEHTILLNEKIEIITK